MDLPESWKEGVKVDWSTTGAGRDDDSELVAVLDPAQANQRRRDVIDWNEDRSLIESAFDDGARLNTPEAHRRAAVESLTVAVQASQRHAETAASWAKAINYHPEVRIELREALDRLTAVLNLIDIHDES